MEPTDVLKVILSLICFFALLFLTYVTTRYIAQKQSKSMKSRNISVVETVMLGADKRLHLVKAGKKYILIATTSKSVVFLSEADIDEEAGKEVIPEKKEKLFDFKLLLEKYKGNYKNAIEKENNIENKENKENKESISVPQDMAYEHSFKSNLDKLKKIVRKNQVKDNGDDVTNEK